MDVSVVITCGPGYFRWLPAAVDSCLLQTAPIKNVIVVYDRCPPLDGLAGVQVVQVHEGNVCAARRAALAVVNTPLVLFLDADDMLPIRFVEKQMKALLKRRDYEPAPVGAYPSVVFCDADLTPVRWHDLDQCWGLREFDRENKMVVSTLVFTAALHKYWKTYGGNGAHEDYLMWGDLLRAGCRFVAVPDIHLVVRMRPNSLSRVRDAAGYATAYAVEDRTETITCFPVTELPDMGPHARRVLAQCKSPWAYLAGDGGFDKGVLGQLARWTDKRVDAVFGVRQEPGGGGTVVAALARPVELLERTRPNIVYLNLSATVLD
jgi:hypothetical protein